MRAAGVKAAAAKAWSFAPGSDGWAKGPFRRDVSPCSRLGTRGSCAVAVQDCTAALYRQCTGRTTRAVHNPCTAVAFSIPSSSVVPIPIADAQCSAQNHKQSIRGFRFDVSMPSRAGGGLRAVCLPLAAGRGLALAVACR
eukprot:363269-Chlamydomonas_euryale.AAC.9